MTIYLVKCFLQLFSDKLDNFEEFLRLSALVGCSGEIVKCRFQFD